MHLLSKHTFKERHYLLQQNTLESSASTGSSGEPEIQIKGLSLCWGCTSSGPWEWEKRKGSQEGDNAMSRVCPSLWVQLQSESQRQKWVTRSLIHSLCKKSVKELHLEVAQQKKECRKNFSIPVTSITHFPVNEIYPTGCCLLLSLAPWGVKGWNSCPGTWPCV